MFAQVMRGVEKDIQIALTVAAMATLIGVTVGAIAGFYRGWVDSLLMRFVDLVLVVPILAVLIVLANKLAKESSNWLGLAIIIGALSWTYVARLVRADFLVLRERDFVEAAKALGATNRRIIVKHMLPNAIGPIIVNATLTVALSIVLESTLSYLGLGVQPPDVSLGLLVGAGTGLGDHRMVALRLPRGLPRHPDPLHLPHRRRPPRGVRPQEEPGQGLGGRSRAAGRGARGRVPRRRRGRSTPCAASTSPSPPARCWASSASRDRASRSRRWPPWACCPRAPPSGDPSASTGASCSA